MRGVSKGGGPPHRLPQEGFLPTIGAPRRHRRSTSGASMGSSAQGPQDSAMGGRASMAAKPPIWHLSAKKEEEAERMREWIQWRRMEEVLLRWQQRRRKEADAKQAREAALLLHYHRDRTFEWLRNANAPSPAVDILLPLRELAPTPPQGPRLGAGTWRQRCSFNLQALETTLDQEEEEDEGGPWPSVAESVGRLRRVTWHAEGLLSDGPPQPEAAPSESTKVLHPS